MFEIENGVPVPPHGMYPWKEMRVGDSPSMCLIVLTNSRQICRRCRQAPQSAWEPDTPSAGIAKACGSGASSEPHAAAWRRCGETNPMMFYKRFIGDYRKKTARLTPLEHGVYGLLLDEYYATEGPLPLNAGELANVVGARTNADNAAIQKVLDRYFTKTNAGWVNDRGLEEMDSARKFSAEQKARIEKRWNGKGSSNTETVPDEYRSDTRLPTRSDEKLDFEPFKAVYPQRSGAQPWAKAVKAANARINEGAHVQTPWSMAQGAMPHSAKPRTRQEPNMSCKRRRSLDRSNISLRRGTRRQAKPKDFTKETSSMELTFLRGTKND